MLAREIASQVTQSPEPLFAAALDGEVVTWNSAMRALAGIQEADALGRRCWEVLGAVDADGSPVCSPSCPFLAAARDGRSGGPVEAIAQMETGGQGTTEHRRLSVVMHHLALRDAAGTPRVVLHVVEEVQTDRQRAGAARQSGVAGAPDLPGLDLTPREHEILELLAAGSSTRDLAAQLGISHATARNAVQRLLDKLDVPNRAAAIARVFGFEITARRAAEQRLATHAAVTRVLAESATLAEAGARLLAELGERLGWEIGDVWLVDREAGVLCSGATWHRADVEIADFAAVSRRARFARGVGLPGRVWASGEPVWIPDVLESGVFVRRAAARAAGIHAACAFPVLRPNGELVGVLDLLSRDIRPPDPALMAMLADIGRQIGQFVQRERAETERARVVAAIEQSPDAVLITDTAGAIVYANPAFERLSGYDLEELLGQNPRLLRSELTGAERYEEMWAALSAGRPWSGSLVNRHKDGTLYEAGSAISPVRDATGALVGYLQVARDVTRERELEARLRQTQRMEMVGRLAGGIAHDFNNLLNAISGYAQLLLADLAADDPHRADVAEIDQAARRAAELTRQLLAFSRRQRLQPMVVDLNAVVSGIARMLQLLLGEDVALHTVLAPDLGAVWADPGQLEQVIINLAVNARDAMPSGGTLTVETANVEPDAGFAKVHPEVTPGPYVRLVVRDTGSGMDAETLAHIFEPFFTTKEEGRGTGLGLATVYGIVKQSGGYIDATSAPGAGASFSIYLPLAREPDTPPRGGNQARRPRVTGDGAPGRGRGGRPRPGPYRARAPRLPGPGRRRRHRGAGHRDGPSGADRPAADRRRPAGPQRPGAGRTTAGRPPRTPRPLHLGLRRVELPGPHRTRAARLPGEALHDRRPRPEGA